MQGCIGDESMATCANLDDSGFEPSLLRQKARTSTILAVLFKVDTGNLPVAFSHLIN